MTNARYAVLIVLLAIGMLACSGGENPVDSGSTSADGVYTNDYFGLTLTHPDDWFVASKDSEQALREAGEGIIAGDDASLKAAVEASKKTTYQLLTLSEFEMGAAVPFNTNLILMAERVSHVPGIKSGGDYLYHTSKLLLQSQLPYEQTKETYPVQLGGGKWHRADFTLNAPEMPIAQSYIATKRDDFVLVLVLSAATDEQMDALEQIAGSITF